MIWTIIGAVIIFSLIVFVHELGHFIAAKAFDVNVLEFAIGMGPALWKKQGKKTLYSLRAVPMGGFCKMEGEDDDTGTPGSFSQKHPLKKIIILCAGAGMNVILGFVIMVIIVGASAGANGGIASVTVDTVNPNSNAASFLKPGDKILKVNDTTVHIKKDISFELSNAGAKESTLVFLRDGERITEKFTPMEIKDDDGQVSYAIGFNVEIQKTGIANVLRESFYQTVWLAKLVFVSIGMLLGGKVGVADMSGPVGVVSAMNTAAQSGWLDFLFLASFLTVNIGIMNLLPLPALDGGRTVFALFELIFRKKVPADKEGIVHFVGIILLVALMLFVTWNDIMRLLTGI